MDIHNRDLAAGIERLNGLPKEIGREKSGVPFVIDPPDPVEKLDRPAVGPIVYLVDMARVDALDPMGEAKKGMRLMDRHVRPATQSLGVNQG